MNFILGVIYSIFLTAILTLFLRPKFISLMLEQGVFTLITLLVDTNTK